jgi:hypothetical protein
VWLTIAEPVAGMAWFLIETAGPVAMSNGTTLRAGDS